ncbi:MAG: hypothetical protein U0T73_09325 [Chitinophagales bacterium]
MQKFTLALFASIVSFCFLYSCKKESAVTPALPEPAFIRSTADMDGEIVAYKYDELHRISEVRSSKYRNNYEYAGPVIKMYHVDSISGTASIVTYTIENGLATSNSLNERFYYDAEGHLTKKFSGNVAVFNATYEDGNLKKQQMEGAVVSYTYFTDKIDTRCLGDMPLNGKCSKNLVQTKTTSAGVTKYVYQFDDQGRVIRESHSGIETGYTLYDYDR